MSLLKLARWLFLQVQIVLEDCLTLLMKMVLHHLLEYVLVVILKILLLRCIVMFNLYMVFTPMDMNLKEQVQEVGQPLILPPVQCILLIQLLEV